MSKRNATRILMILVVVVSGVFVWLRIDSGMNYGQLFRGSNSLALLGSVSLISVSVVALGLLWLMLMRCLDPSLKTDLCLRAFIYSWLLRYMPGTVPYHAARVLMAPRIGTSKRVVATSIVYEGLLTVGACAFVAMIGLAVGLGAHSMTGISYVIVGLPMVSLPFVLHPRVLVPITNRLLHVVGREPLPNGSLPSGTGTMLAFLGYVAVVVLCGLSFYLVTIATIDVQINPALAIGSYALSMTIGILVVFVPSGIGVREAVIVAVLSSVTSPEQALFAAGAIRALSVIGDLIPPAILGAWDVSKRWLHVASHAPMSAPSGPPSR